MAVPWSQPSLFSADVPEKFTGSQVPFSETNPVLYTYVLLSTDPAVTIAPVSEQVIPSVDSFALES